jgi:hypothetical protein
MSRLVSQRKKRSVSQIEERWLKVFSTLNEFQARLFAAERALGLGRGGITRVAALTGMSRTTITKASQELEGNRKPAMPPEGRIRQAGGGRKRVEDLDPTIRSLLQEIVEETTAGDPMSLLRWTSKSTRTIADELTKQGHAISWRTVARYLGEMGYTLQSNQKTREGPQHPDRDAQFRYIQRQVKSFLRTLDPVISVDTKKKELMGAFKNAGQTWRRQANPEKVNVYDFPHLGKGKGIPYGAYDIAGDRAVVNVGVTHDTAEFAVESIRRWWKLDGRRNYPAACRLLICADAGGSNGSRLRAWKLHLQRLSDQTGVPISVCHYPPGTSKWNKIEHRLFSFISLNWKGKPLVNFETIVNLIGGTRTRSGLKVKAVLDTRYYETGTKVSDLEYESIHLHRHKLHPDWNYTIKPALATQS